MATKPTKRKKNRAAFSTPGQVETRPDVAIKTPKPVMSEGRRWYLIAVFLVIAIGGTYLARSLRPAAEVEHYTYEIVNEYPHDAVAFTQGLVLEDGFAWESTGKLDGQSSIRKVDLKTGEVVIMKALPADEFGEGLAMVGDKLYQLTWKNEVCHVYDRELNKIKDFKYNGQGWGLTYDGKHLIMSDGSSRLSFIDPETFEIQRSISVRRGRSPIRDLNELEYTGGSIYANRLRWDKIYEIDPKTGNVLSIINLGNLWTERPREGVLNGIAVDSKTQQLIVTGKYCPTIFEIKLKRK